MKKKNFTGQTKNTTFLHSEPSVLFVQPINTQFLQILTIKIVSIQFTNNTPLTVDITHLFQMIFQRLILLKIINQMRIMQIIVLVAHVDLFRRGNIEIARRLLKTLTEFRGDQGRGITGHHRQLCAQRNLSDVMLMGDRGLCGQTLSG